MSISEFLSFYLGWFWFGVVEGLALLFGPGRIILPPFLDIDLSLGSYYAGLFAESRFEFFLVAFIFDSNKKPFWSEFLVDKSILFAVYLLGPILFIWFSVLNLSILSPLRSMVGKSL